MECFQVYPNGQIILLAYFFATHNCAIKVCNLEFSDELGTLFMLFGTGEFDFEAFKPKPVLFADFHQGEVMISSVLYQFVITRQPQFWICLVILPTLLIGWLVLIGIFFGEESHSFTGLVS
ncbi:hypothetical protein PENTCL1PPCAC_20368, partial [Pristionchus entomophagus]